MNADFNSIYEKLTPALQQLEEQRKKLKRQGIRTGLIAGGICFAVICSFLIYHQGGWAGFIFSFVIGSIVLTICVNSQSKPLSAYYKKNIISGILNELCEDAVYSPKEGIPAQTFISCGLFSDSPDRYHCEDLIYGKIDKTIFSCSEVVADKKQITTDSKGKPRETWVNIFKGFLFIADFQKDFAGHTVVFRNSWFRLYTGGERVKLENPEFEKNYDTYSTDQVEARYLLTPNMMERILALDRKFPGKITVSFYRSLVIIAIPDSTNHFEASIWESQLESSHIKNEYTTLSHLLEIIHDLNLNLRIWTKE